MKLTTVELVSVGLLIAYISFFTQPAVPSVKSVLASSVGSVVALLALVYVTAYKSLIVGVFLAIAYVLTVSASVTEYLDPTAKPPAKKEEEKKKIPEAPKPSLPKGDTVAHHAKAGKSETTPPPAKEPVKPAAPSKVEHFTLF
jgi:mannitol-specific phosphotransferase system IIBC component